VTKWLWTGLKASFEKVRFQLSLKTSSLSN